MPLLRRVLSMNVRSSYCFRVSMEKSLQFRSVWPQSDLKLISKLLIGHPGRLEQLGIFDRHQIRPFSWPIFMRDPSSCGPKFVTACFQHNSEISRIQAQPIMNKDKTFTSVLLKFHFAVNELCASINCVFHKLIAKFRQPNDIAARTLKITATISDG